MRLAEIRRYPVKSLRGHSLVEGIAERVGLAGDRRWMIVDLPGKFLTQRQHPRLAQIDAIPTESGLELRHAEHGTLEVRYPLEDAPLETVPVWRDLVGARIATAASDYLSGFLHLPVRLAYLHDVETRHPLFEIRVERGHIFRLCICIGRIWHRRIERMAVGDTKAQRSVEIREAEASNAVFGIGRDIGRVDGPDRDRHPQAAGERGPAGHSMARCAIAEFGEVFTARD
jgi:hypothetical protein